MLKYSVSAILVTAMLADTTARADALDEKRACVAAADEGQVLRDEGKLRLAHEAFTRCARTSCPKLVSADCSQWRRDVEQRAPTIVVSAKDPSGNALTGVRVMVDGEPLLERLDGKPLLMDSGEHVFRYEAPGFEAVEQRITIAAGDRQRALTVHFAASPAHSAEKARAAAALDEPSRDTGGRSVPVPSWIFGGTALAAFASATYFGVSGVSQRGRALGSDGCAPNCPASEKTSIQTKFLVADISLGIGLISAGLATYFFLRPRESAPRAVANMTFAPQKAGGVAVFRSTF